jgi:HPt (histidine-containing phosphotransfer) domain-containing protein
MDDYLPKPFTRDAVRDMLARWCGRLASPRQVPHARAPVTKAESDEELCTMALAMLCELEDPDRPGVVRAVMSRFLHESEDLANDLALARQRGDAVGLRSISHTLKSTSAIVGATALAACCSKLEIAARDGRMEEATGLVDEVVLLLYRVKPAINRYIDTLAAAMQPEDVPADA